MKQKLLLLIVVSLFFGCRTIKDTSNNGIAFLTLEKTSCRGQCPVFSLSIFENGLVQYTGSKNVDKIGKYEKTLSKTEIKNLKKTFAKSDFFSFENEYTGKITDLPSTYISYTHNGQTKKIRDYYGAPEKLKELEEILNKIAQNKDGWKKIEE
ncbi:MAG: DUF6438 domain-containing protein [Bacteroidales bacterium]|nr:DUF6438 domain-containing protein [Bacteroidales bacterium]